MLKTIKGSIFAGMIVIIICLCGCRTENKSWIVTSYADSTGNQAMFYTIARPSRGWNLIVIDGGWEGNTENVRSIIEKYGNHIDAWIVTHYHNDHVGAFNDIFPDPRGIIIDAVYDSPMDYKKYLEVAQEWDDPASYTKYREVTENRDKVHHIARDENLVIDGLTFRFFNTYDSLITDFSDIPNNASLIFKVTNQSESMLFTADCHSDEIAEFIIDRYGENLKSDYYQAPHHGNSTNWREMIEAVSPKYVFLDGPKWLMEGEQYKARELISYCEEHGIDYGNYSTAPNTIILN